jgi:uncharacterized FAD-dependent dehydrogenase
MIYDIGIIGTGVSGVFAAYKLAKENKNSKKILFELGRPPLKRRRQLEGWLGSLPNSDGKIYTSDLHKVQQVAGSRLTKSAYNFVSSLLSEVSDLKLTKDKGPSASMQKKLLKNNYSIELNDYIQLYTKEIHQLSRVVSSFIEDSGFTYNFDDEVVSISKQKNIFCIQTQAKEFKCKKVLLCVGRSGWRWAGDVFKKFGIIENNNVSRYGVRVEMPSPLLKDFNKSSCSLIKENIEIGPFSWYGTVIPEDHVDLAISSFRSNENRWKTDKVSFNIIGDIVNKNVGMEQTDRIGKLTFVLANDRIVKEKISSFLNEKSTISVIPEYKSIKNNVQELSKIIPEIATKGYFYVPTIIPMAPQINIGTNMETEVEGLFVAGETAGIHGILSAATTGIIAANAMLK